MADIRTFWTQPRIVLALLATLSIQIQLVVNDHPKGFSSVVFPGYDSLVMYARPTVFLPKCNSFYFSPSKNILYISTCPN